MNDRPNIALPDELAAIRAQMKALETREAEIRVAILNDPSTRTGKDWVAEVRKVTQDRVDLKELRACYPAEVEEQTHPVEITRIVLSAIDQDTGEIMSARKFRKAEDAAA